MMIYQNLLKSFNQKYVPDATQELRSPLKILTRMLHTEQNYDDDFYDQYELDATSTENRKSKSKMIPLPRIG